MTCGGMMRPRMPAPCRRRGAARAGLCQAGKTATRRAAAPPQCQETEACQRSQGMKQGEMSGGKDLTQHCRTPATGGDRSDRTQSECSCPTAPPPPRLPLAPAAGAGPTVQHERSRMLRCAGGR